MATTVVDPHADLERKVSRRLRDDDCHRAVANVLAQVASAAIYPAHHPLAGESGMTGLLEDPVASATHVAVETLIDELEDLLDALPRSTVNLLATEQLLAELGLE